MRAKMKIAVAAAVAIAALGAQAGIADAATHHARKHHAKRHSAVARQTNAAGSTPVSSDAGSTPVSGDTGGGCGHGGRGDHGGPGNETPLTGDTKTQAEAAAQAAYPDGTIWRSSIEDPGDASGAAYEVHVTKADGTEIEVLEDSAFKVIATQASPQSRHGDDGGH